MESVELNLLTLWMLINSLLKLRGEISDFGPSRLWTPKEVKKGRLGLSRLGLKPQIRPLPRMLTLFEGISVKIGFGIFPQALWELGGYQNFGKELLFIWLFQEGLERGSPFVIPYLL